MTAPNRAVQKSLGVLLLDDESAQTLRQKLPDEYLNVPLHYEIVAGLTLQKLIADDRKILHLPSVLRAAKKLQKLGCTAIIGEGGYFAHFQREVAASLQVPLLISILHLVPLMQRMIGPGKDVGVLMANAQYLTERHLDSVGVAADSRLIVGSTENDYRAISVDEAQTAFLQVGESFYEEHPTLGAILLEYAGFTPHAQALREAINIPVLDWHNFIEMGVILVRN